MTDRAAEHEGSLPLSGALRVDEICRRFEAAWKASLRPRLVDFLAEAAEPDRAALLRELIPLDVHYRRLAGEALAALDYLGDFPALGPEWLRQVVSAEDLPKAPPPLPSDPPRVGEGVRWETTSMRLMLKVVKGPHIGQEFAFTQHDTFIVGRSKQAQFRLSPTKNRDLYVSRMHFMVEINPPLCRILDLKSRNHTYVNRKKIACIDLKHGDLIRVGNTTLQVSIEVGPGEDTEAGSNVFEITPSESSVSAAPPRPALDSPDRAVCPACQDATAEVGVCAGCRRKASARDQPIPGYLLVRELGRGGMGVVYFAVHEAAGSVVALKMIVPAVASPTPNQIQRFLREAHILRKLDHPNIVAFRDIGEASGVLYFAMDYVAGTDAARLLNKEKRLAVRAAVRLVLPLLTALEHAHELGFVHRDVKPANLLIQTDCRPNRVMVADFGLARVYQASKLSGLTLLGDVGGTVGFMPPEQILRYREAKPAADQYSAAATLYNLLTNRYIHDLSGPVRTQLDKILKQNPVPVQRRRSEIPARLAAVIHRALARRPESRYPDVRAFRRALLPFGK